MNEFKINKYTTQKFSGMGSDIIKLINFTETQLGKGFWIIGDVELTDTISRLVENKIYSSEELIKNIDEDIQFTWGTFIFFKEEKLVKSDKKIYTESKEKMHFEQSCVEIRAFDTSYFEVYSFDENFIKELKCFNL